MQEDLQGVGEIDEMLVVGRKDDGFACLAVREVEAEDVMYEEMGLACHDGFSVCRLG